MRRTLTGRTEGSGIKWQASRGKGIVDRLLKVKEVAEILAVQPGTIRKMVQANRIPYYRFSRCGKPRFKEKELEKWMERHKNGRRKI